MGSGWWYMLMDRYLGGMSVGGGPLRVEFAVWGMCVVPSCAGCVVRVVMRYVCVQRAVQCSPVRTPLSSRERQETSERQKHQRHQQQHWQNADGQESCLTRLSVFIWPASAGLCLLLIGPGEPRRECRVEMWQHPAPSAVCTAPQSVCP